MKLYPKNGPFEDQWIVKRSRQVQEQFDKDSSSVIFLPGEFQSDSEAGGFLRSLAETYHFEMDEPKYQSLDEFVTKNASDVVRWFRYVAYFSHFLEPDLLPISAPT